MGTRKVTIRKDGQNWTWYHFCPIGFSDTIYRFGKHKSWEVAMFEALYHAKAYHFGETSQEDETEETRGKA